MTRFYYVDREQKTVFVFDTNPEDITCEYISQSDHPNIRAQASMYLRNEVGYTVLSNPTSYPGNS